MEETSLEELKQEARDLGIEFSANIGAAKLQAKIDAYYAGQENSSKEVIEAVKVKEESKQKDDNTLVTTTENRDTINAISKARAEANKTRVVTIIDNDQRVNNQTTTVTVNCSNVYFDLGTVILPLNLPVEVRQGHLNVLKELMIPQHVKDGKTGLSTVRMVPRYTLSYENNN